jgi:hypothetical protein
MRSTLMAMGRRAVEVVAAAGAGACRLGARLVCQVVRFMRALRGWPAVAVVWWLLRQAGVPASTATALVLGPCLVTLAVVWWVLVVEPRLFAPRPSIRPRVLPGGAQRGAVDESAVYVASYVGKSGQVIDVEARLGPHGGGVS